MGGELDSFRQPVRGDPWINQPVSANFYRWHTETDPPANRLWADIGSGRQLDIRDQHFTDELSNAGDADVVFHGFGP